MTTTAIDQSMSHTENPDAPTVPERLDSPDEGPVADQAARAEDCGPTSTRPRSAVRPPGRRTWTASSPAWSPMSCVPGGAPGTQPGPHETRSRASS